MAVLLKTPLLLNADVGEGWAALESGEQTSLLRCLDLANVCCGAHAGDAALTRHTMAEAAGLGLRLGAHPGYEDPENFGRLPRFQELGHSAVVELVARQVHFAASVAAECGQRLFHVKAHGALYNEASRSEAVATAIAQGVRQVLSDVVLLGLAGTVMLPAFERAGFAVLAESFADRGYTPEGFLIPRGQPGADVEDPAAALANLPKLAALSDTICIHGDGPQALRLAQALRAALDS